MLRLLAPLGIAAVLAASETQPHDHQGKLTPYQIGPPSLLLSSSDEARLQSGKAVMQAIVSDDAQSRRLIMVQDIPAPSSIVMGRIVDLNHYDRMVSGVDACVMYASNEAKGIKTMKATYEVSALKMGVKYYVEHQFDPEARCMTFNLDYSRRSDIDDTVGYWYVEPTGRASCRVFYSCECKLRGWVPTPVYNMLTKEALKKATTWVNTESIKEWQSSRKGNPGQFMVQFVDNVREQMRDIKLPQLQLPQPPRLVEQWMDDRRRAAVRFVSAVRPNKATSNSL